MSGLSEGFLAGRLFAEGFLAALFPIAFEVPLAIAFEVASFVFRAGRSGGTGRAALLKVTVTAAQESVVVVQVFVVLKTFVFVVFILKAAFEVFTVVVEASLVVKHRSNLVRLVKGCENKIY